MPVTPAPCIAYAGCDDGVPVYYCAPSADLDVTRDGARAVWSFFQTF
jgi:hypothetical protein